MNARGFAFVWDGALDSARGDVWKRRRRSGSGSTPRLRSRGQGGLLQYVRAMLPRPRSGRGRQLLRSHAAARFGTDGPAHFGGRSLRPRGGRSLPRGLVECAIKDCSISASENLLGATACREAFAPLRTLGEPCTNSQECVPAGNVRVGCSGSDGDGTCELGPLEALLTAVQAKRAAPVATTVPNSRPRVSRRPSLHRP
jgi:hypothetical protein